MADVGEAVEYFHNATSYRTQHEHSDDSISIRIHIHALKPCARRGEKTQSEGL